MFLHKTNVIGCLIFGNMVVWKSSEGEMRPRRNVVILGIIKAHYNIVKTRPSYVNCGNINMTSTKMPSSRIYNSFHFHLIILLISFRAIFEINRNFQFKQIRSFSLIVLIVHFEMRISIVNAKKESGKCWNFEAGSGPLYRKGWCRGSAK